MTISKPILKIKCKICNSQNQEIYELKNVPSGAQVFKMNYSTSIDQKCKFTIFECENCGLVQAKTKKVPYYKHTIRSSSFSKLMLDYRRKQFSQFIKNFKDNNLKVFELGCGRGEFLDIFSYLNCKTFGIEGSKTNVNFCSSKNHKTIHGYLKSHKDLPFKKKFFDMFVSFNFIEHLSNPLETLKLCKIMLKPNAMGILEVPNFDMIKNNFLFNEFIPDHLFYFTKETFRTLLTMAGFNIIEIKTSWDNYIISAKVNLKEKIDWKNFDNKKKQLDLEIKSFFSGTNKNHNAIWSAGHQSLTTISTLELQKIISFIIDSATFKQNKFAPGSGLPIISPKMIQASQIKKILLAAAGFNEEIFKNINQFTNEPIKIGFLDKGKVHVVQT